MHACIGKPHAAEIALSIKPLLSSLANDLECSWLDSDYSEHRDHFHYQGFIQDFLLEGGNLVRACALFFCLLCSFSTI